MPIFKDQEQQELIHHHPWPPKPLKQNAEREEVIADTSSWASNMDARSGPQRLQTSDREVLIRSIKKGESPTWVPNRSLEEYFATHGDPPHSRLEGQLNIEKSHPLLPAAEIKKSPERGCNSEILTSCASEIERPRSALHSGDFREGSPQDHQPGDQEPFGPDPSRVRFNSSPTTPWYTPTSPPRPTRQDVDSILARSRARAPSLNSFSSSFILKAPTSPLVHQANNTDLDFSSKIDPLDLSSSSDNTNRRRTLPPESFMSFQSSPPGSLRGAMAPNSSRSWRREATFPYQAHQPRRSLTSAYTLQPASSPQTPFIARSRRPSFSTDISSPLHHATMVGSYEESILRGRMSTSPSKPLDFTAQIGVLGREVGTTMSDVNTNVTTQQEWRRREKRSRRSSSPKSPPGGCYRIPQLGQLQIIIKNPNKTAVKLFLVPYELEGMEPGTKTFIRQRSYSAGPIIDMPLSARTNIGTDPTEASLGMNEDPAGKPILRYLIHLNICCPSRGRFYLYSGIRVVFANRVPDGKEKLINEIQYPDPQYSPYKPSKEIASRHRNAGYGPGLQPITPMRIGLNKREPNFYAQTPPLPHLKTLNFGLPVHASGNARLDASDCEKRGMEEHDPHGPHSLFGNFSSQAPSNPNDLPTLPLSSINSLPSLDLPSSSADASNMYSKRQKGDVGYGSPSGMSSIGSETGESLLARKLRKLDVMLNPDVSDEKQGGERMATALNWIIISKSAE
ncbi:conserved hypothetical protein [Histoplasma mississippiense (nom. inval.)]|uniref:conserved hypothetical protein n=1 Tax=Ajellomyces capsulatus (strain NAm1 / WU24) TaxID=2059318 RepID=UPI000157B645|nr:conserved hypothetical protein [Histoplasma mississippiense (nom. inval.)]EDN02906.1 conserved hypothetical protein [Histoplasma mississippiense (nom. inval.)]